MSVTDAVYEWECDICHEVEDHHSDRHPPRGFVQYNGKDLCEECYGDELRKEQQCPECEDDDCYCGDDADPED
jgi:hypothetical protein